MTEYRLKTPIQIYWSVSEGRFVIAEGTINRPIWYLDIAIPQHLIDYEEDLRRKCNMPPLPPPVERRGE